MHSNRRSVREHKAKKPSVVRETMKKTSNDDNGRAWLVLHVCVGGDKENNCFVQRSGQHRRIARKKRTLVTRV